MSSSEIRRHFKSPHSLLENAHEHFSRLDKSIHRWLEQNPFELKGEFDPNEGAKIYRMHLKDDLPREFSTIAYDIASNLRSALDHAVYASAVCFGAIESRNTNFPFARTAEGVEAALTTGNSRDAPHSIKPLLRSFEPYESGNSILWALNRMRNTRTHAILMEPSIHTNGVKARPIFRPGTEWRGTGSMEFRVGEWDPELRAIEVLRVRGQEPDYDLAVNPYIAAQDVEILRGRPILKVFQEIGPMVEGIVQAIEAETVRLLM